MDSIQRVYGIDGDEIAKRILTPHWIRDDRTNQAVAYQVPIKKAAYLLLSHPVSRFKRCLPYWIGSESHSFCVEMGLVPVFLLNYNRFTLLRVYSEIARKLFQPRAEAIPNEGYACWKVIPRSIRYPKLSSLNYVLREDADLTLYEDEVVKIFEDYFTFGFWSLPENGYTPNTVLLDGQFSIHLALKATKSLFIPGKIETVKMDLGYAEQQPVATINLKCLVSEKGNFKLADYNQVILARGLTDDIENEQKHGKFIINGVMCDFIKRESQRTVLSAVTGYDVSYIDVLKSIIGLVVHQEFKEHGLFRVCTLEELRQQVQKATRTLGVTSSIGNTIGDNIEDPFAFALESLSPMLTEDRGDIFYLHPSAYISLLENGIINQLTDSRRDIPNIVRLLDLIKIELKVESCRGKISEYFPNKPWGFSGALQNSLLKALEEIVLSLKAENPLYRFAPSKVNPNHGEVVRQEIVSTSRVDILTSDHKTIFEAAGSVGKKPVTTRKD